MIFQPLLLHNNEFEVFEWVEYEGQKEYTLSPCKIPVFPYSENRQNRARMVEHVQYGISVCVISIQSIYLYDSVPVVRVLE
jgi:hypothetical protein